MLTRWASPGGDAQRTARTEESDVIRPQHSHTHNGNGPVQDHGHPHEHDHDHGHPHDHSHAAERATRRAHAPSSWCSTSARTSAP